MRRITVRSETPTLRAASVRRYGARPDDGILVGYLDRMRGTVFGSNVHGLGDRNPALAGTAKLFRERLSGRLSPGRAVAPGTSLCR